jgi:hypothetical protein
LAEKNDETDMPEFRLDAGQVGDFITFLKSP